MSIQSTFRMLALTALAASVVACDGEGATGPAGPAGVPGDPGDQGNPGDKGDAAPGEPSINGITPHIAYLERSIEVTISGFGTEFTNPTVDFGAGITVDNVTVASGTGIVATVTIDPGAALGTRDVIVSESGTDFTYADAFTVREPLLYTPIIGTPDQGGLVLARIDLLDTSMPFDTSGGGYFVTGSEAGGALLQDLSPFSAEAFYFVDVTSTGDADVLVDSGLTIPVTSRVRAAITPVARTATVLTAGTTETVTMPMDWGTLLYEIDVPANMVVTIDLTPDSAVEGTFPVFNVLPSSGSYNDARSLLNTGGTFATISDDDGEKFYLAVFDAAEIDSYDIDIDVATAASDDSDPTNDVCAGAIDLGTQGDVPVSLTNLGILDENDEDWFKITVDASAVGMAIRAITSPGDSDTDTYIEFYQDDCTTPVGAASPDFADHENHASGALPAAGTYYIRVRNSPDFSHVGTLYNLDVDLELVPEDEVEPNDSSVEADANNAYAVSTAFIGFGDVSDASDIDFWKITTSVAADIHAVIIDGATDYCSSFNSAIDTRVEILDNSGALIETDNPIDYCSDVTAAGQAAGVYYITVTESQAYPGAAPFDYGLSITLE